MDEFQFFVTDDHEHEVRSARILSIMFRLAELVAPFLHDFPKCCTAVCLV